MNTMYFRYALELASCGSMQKAADRLGVDRSSVSRNIKRLEEELGVRLFFHTPDGIVPTHFGDICLRHAADILQEEDDLLFDFTGAENYTGIIHVGMGINRSAQFLPLILPEFNRRYPHISVRLHEMNSTELNYSLLNGELQFAITCQPQIGEDFAFVPLMTERLMLVAAKDDPFPLEHLCMDTPTPYVNLSAFRDKPFILGDPAQKSRKVCDDVFEQLGFKPWILLQSQYNRTSILLASQGIGYALVPSSIRGTQENLAYYPIDPLLHNSWTIGVTWLKTRRLSHSALQLKQIVVEILREPDQRNKNLKSNQ